MRTGEKTLIFSGDKRGLPDLTTKKKLYIKHNFKVALKKEVEEILVEKPAEEKSESSVVITEEKKDAPLAKVEV